MVNGFRLIKDYRIEVPVNTCHKQYPFYGILSVTGIENKIKYLAAKKYTLKWLLTFAANYARFMQETILNH
jgi:hypothetical protein